MAGQLIVSQTTNSMAQTCELRISVIIPLLNALDTLPTLLDALLRQSLPVKSYEVIFVDNGSTDGSLAWLEANCRPGVRFLCCHDRRGSYAARNLGLTAAAAASIAFTDADGRPDPSWLEAGLEALDRSPLVAGRIVLVYSGRPSTAELVDAGRFLRQSRFVQERFGATANLFVQRRVFDCVGAFDERLLSGGDHEFGQRATSKGFPIIYEADSLILHPCRRTFRAISAKAWRVGYGFGQSLVLHRESTIRSSLSRTVDRVKLSAGKGLDQTCLPSLGTLGYTAIVATIVLLNLITLIAFPFGSLAMIWNGIKASNSRSPGVNAFPEDHAALSRS